VKNVAILLSGRGSNFLALSDAIEAGQIPARIVLVVSNKPDAPALEHARERNYEAICIPSVGIEREAYDRQVGGELILKWTSRAPADRTISTILRLVVPRTMESSIKITL